MSFVAIRMLSEDGQPSGRAEHCGAPIWLPISALPLLLGFWASSSTAKRLAGPPRPHGRLYADGLDRDLA